MCSSSSSSTSCLSTLLSLHLPRKTRLSRPFPILADQPTNPRRRRLSSVSASITRENLELSWVSPDRREIEDYNGWSFVEEAVIPKKHKKGPPTFLLLGIGTSIVALLAVFARFTLSGKGFVLRFSNPLHVFVHNKSLGSDETSKVDTESVHEEADESAEEVTDHIKLEEGKPGRIVVPFYADSTQQEALLLLKNLKIIEDEVKADELCTKREYARWLVLVNSRLERNPKNQIIPSIALAGSTCNAFDDINNEDPDFQYVQALAEAGIVLSKLSHKNSTSEGVGAVNFFPGRFISRQDLVSWKGKLEYKFMPGIDEEISRNKIGFLDAREIESDALPVLFVDMLANNKSITRNVFGQGKRFQPGKPCTKAQAAVALTSGRTTEAILDEFSKLVAENSSRQFAMKEIRSELLERGYIKKHWEKKLEDEKVRGAKVKAAYLAALRDLESGKIDQENAYLKEKAALDCQRQLLASLKEEVDEMKEKLACERVDFVGEQRKVKSALGELEVKYERALDTKSILEAELEALRILRCWIEEEAKKGQARTKVLEEAGRRWKWGNRS